MRPALVMIAYGAILGTGLPIAISGSAYYLLLMWPVVLGSPLAGIVLFGVYGFARTTPVLLLSRVTTDTNGLERCLVVVDNSVAIVQMLSAIVLAATAGWIAGLAAAGV